MFETLYRCLYWHNNELQIIGNEFCRRRSLRIERAMRYLEERIGYVPNV